MTTEYKICSYCIMDTSDLHINFDSDGRCDYCHNYESNIKPNWKVDDVALKALADAIKKEGENKDFDCIIGLSGGLDSSNAAYVAKEKMGLRPLLFHVDAGWNTDQAVGNIEKLIEGLGLELYTEVVNWEEDERSAAFIPESRDLRSGFGAGCRLFLRTVQICA